MEQRNDSNGFYSNDAGAALPVAGQKNYQPETKGNLKMISQENEPNPPGAETPIPSAPKEEGDAGSSENTAKPEGEAD